MIAAWATLVAVSACGSASTGGAPSVASSGTSPAASSRSAAGVAIATADDRGLSAFALLDAAGYRTALGEDVIGPEDDGGIPSLPGHLSTSRVDTARTDTVLTVSLSSLDNAQDAQQTYSARSRGAPSPSAVPGLGDQAVQSKGTVMVLKGAQVLVITATPGPTTQKRLEDIKRTGGDPTSGYAQVYAMARTLAPALVAHLTGQPSTSPVLALPRGAVDPCISQDAASRLFPKATSSVSNQASEMPPATQCSIQLPGGSFMMQVVSDEQLAGSIAPTTVAKLLAADLATHQNAPVTYAQPPGAGAPVQDLAPMNGFYAANPEPDVETAIGKCLFRLTLPGSHTFTAAGEVDNYDAAYLANIIRTYLDSRALGIRLDQCATKDEIDRQLRQVDALRNGSVSPLAASLLAVLTALLAF